MTNKRTIISELIITHAKDPEKTALQLYSGEILTYGELISLQQQTRHALTQFNIQPHERIAFITDNRLAFLPLTVAVMEIATCVPLDPELTLEQISDNYQFFSIDYLLCNQIAGPAIEAATAYGIGIIHFSMEETNHPTAIRFDMVHQSRISSRQDYKNDQTAFIFTTSGTTSRPKIVPVMYRNLTDALEIEAKNYGYTENSIQLLAVKLFRAITIRAAFRVLMSNGKIIYTDGVHPKRIADTLLKFPVTHLNLQPAGMFAIYEYFEKNSLEYTLQHRLNISLMGAPLPAHLKNNIETRFNAKVFDVYGMTEVSMITTTFQTPKGYKPGSVGCPVFQKIKILDNEVMVKGSGVFPGYENDPEANLDSFVEGWFRTGDVGYIDEDGYLFLKGRIKELINRGGEKVSPFEVEEAILALGNIKDVCVFPYPNKRGYENVGAVIVSNQESAISLKELRSALREKLNPFKQPTILYKIDKIPVSSANKVQRSLLYQQLNDLGLVPETIKNSAAAAEIEVTTTQFTITEIWKTILEQDFIALDDNFFDIGGDSLSAAEVLAAIETNFGCILPVNQFFEKSTIGEIAELVDAIPHFNPYKHLVPIRPGGSKTPIFFVHDLYDDIVLYHNVTVHIDRERPVYGLKCNRQREEWDSTTNMQEVIQAYSEEIQKVRPAGPYYLAGLSIGGYIAFAVGCLLAQQHEVIVFMIDTFSANYVRNRQIKKLTNGALISLKQASLSQIPALFCKKIGTLYKKFILPEINPKSQRYTVGELNQLLRDEESEQGKNARLLRAMRENHRPAYFPGLVCYFRALQSSGYVNLSYTFWKSQSKEFILFETECEHADFVKPQYCVDTAAKINSVIKGHETKMS